MERLVVPGKTRMEFGNMTRKRSINVPARPSTRPAATATSSQLWSTTTWAATSSCATTPNPSAEPRSTTSTIVPKDLNSLRAGTPPRWSLKETTSKSTSYVPECKKSAPSSSKSSPPSSSTKMPSTAASLSASLTRIPMAASVSTS